MKAFIRIICIAITTIISPYVFAQVTISGPTCVIKGTVYQYNISSNWDSTSSMNICLQGGMIADSININACTTSEKPVPYAMVQWDTLGAVSITVTSTSGNATLAVTVVNPLIPGTLDTASSFQNIGYDSIPATLLCSADEGGSCNPNYNDQWQMSTDQMVWTDIPGATGQNLTYTDSLTQTTYFRRKVVETNSGTIGYSDVAMVSVAPPPPTGFNEKEYKQSTGMNAIAFVITGEFNNKNL